MSTVFVAMVIAGLLELFGSWVRGWAAGFRDFTLSIRDRQSFRSFSLVCWFTVLRKTHLNPYPRWSILLLAGWCWPFPLPTVESYALIYSIIPLTGEIPAIIMQHSRSEFAICSSQSTKRLQKTGMSNPTQKVVSHGSILWVTLKEEQ